MSWDLPSCEVVARLPQPNVQAVRPGPAPAAGGGTRRNAQGSNRRLTSLSKLAGTHTLCVGCFGEDSHATKVEREATGLLSQAFPFSHSSAYLEGNYGDCASGGVAVDADVSSAVIAGALTLDLLEL